MKKKRLVSIVIPAYNESQNIKLLYVQLTKVFKSAKFQAEILFIDDGSTDDTLAEMKQIQAKDAKVKVIQLRRNFGQTPAMMAGFDAAEGEVIIPLDADLQNDPQDIPRLLAKLDEGYDIVSGWRKDRQDAQTSRVLPSKIANTLIGWISGVKLHDFGCTMKAYRSEILKEIRLYGEMHRFIPAIAAGVGAKITELPISHHPRRFGSSKYGLGRIFRVMLDVLTIKFLLSYQTRPLHLFGYIGLSLSSLGSFVFTWLVLEKIILGHHLSDRPLFLIAIFFVIIGLQFITIGVLAETMMRIYYESQNKKPYYIKHIWD